MYERQLSGARMVYVQRALFADCVEKLRNSDIAIFLPKPVMLRGQMRSFVRPRGRPFERRKANLAEPLAPKIWSPWMAKNFVTQTEKQSFSTQSARSDFHIAAQIGENGVNLDNPRTNLQLVYRTS